MKKQRGVLAQGKLNFRTEEPKEESAEAAPVKKRELKSI